MVTTTLYTVAGFIIGTAIMEEVLKRLNMATLAKFLSIVAWVSLALYSIKFTMDYIHRIMYMWGV